jgi:glycosyltransferase involved in cell wall biosynthesis
MDNILVIGHVARESGGLQILKNTVEFASNDFENNFYFIIDSALTFQQIHKNIIFINYYNRGLLGRLIYEFFEIPKIIRLREITRVINLQNFQLVDYKRPTLVLIHNALILKQFSHLLDFKSKIKMFLLRNLIKRSQFPNTNFVVQLSWFMKELERGKIIHTNRISLVKTHLEINTRRIVHTKDSKEYSFIYPSTLFKYKNVHKVVKAIEKAVSIEPGLNLRLYLTCSKNDYESSYGKLESQYVIFLGRVSQIELFNIMSQSILIFASEVESLGLPLIEAKNLNIRILSINRPYALEILNGYNKARFFNEFNQLSESIIEFKNFFNIDSRYQNDIDSLDFKTEGFPNLIESIKSI